MAETIVKKVGGYTFFLSSKTGKPRGQPPKNDPKKLKLYNQLKAEAERAAEDLYTPRWNDDDASEVLVEPETHPELSDAEVLEMIKSRFHVMRKLTEGACMGANKSVVFSGAPGIGKTNDVERITTHYSETEGVSVGVMSGGAITSVKLFEMLYEFSTPNSVFVLDDTDKLWKDDDSVAILKVAMDTKSQRWLNWQSNSHILKNANIPNKFLFEGSIIVITNEDWQTEVDARSKRSVHMKPIMTRSHYLDLMIHEPRHVMLWIDHIVREENILVSRKNLTEAQQDMVLVWMRANMNNVRALSIRTALKIADHINLHGDDWEMFARVTELRTMGE